MPEKAKRAADENHMKNVYSADLSQCSEPRYYGSAEGIKTVAAMKNKQWECWKEKES